MPSISGHSGATPGRGSTVIRRADKRSVLVVEVGPRDGLQNEPGTIPTEVKVQFVNDLSAAGLRVIETTSFVNPKAVPQLADAGEVMRQIVRHPGVRYPVLVPNLKGFERAIGGDATAIALFTAATEAFASANVGTSIAGTFVRFAPILERARKMDVWVRGYISVAFGCPYTGEVSPTTVVDLASRLFELGCSEVAIADTIGVATPDDVDRLLRVLAATMPISQIALHFHDTHGQALRNVEVGLSHGIHIFDAAAGGLGGCPFAPGAPGNLATETLVQYLDERGDSTGVRRDGVAAATSTLRAHLTASDRNPRRLHP